jgi:hypothetical protein
MISVSFKIIPISNNLSVNRDAYDMWYHLGDQLATILLYHPLAIFSSVTVIVAGRIKSKWNKNDNNAMIITIATIIQMIYNSPPVVQCFWFGLANFFSLYYSITQNIIYGV